MSRVTVGGTEVVFGGSSLRDRVVTGVALALTTYTPDHEWILVGDDPHGLFAGRDVQTVGADENPEDAASSSDGLVFALSLTDDGVLKAAENSEVPTVCLHTSPETTGKPWSAYRTDLVTTGPEIAGEQTVHAPLEQAVLVGRDLPGVEEVVGRERGGGVGCVVPEGTTDEVVAEYVDFLGAVRCSSQDLFGRSYTVCLPEHSGWPTAAHLDAVMAGSIPLLHPDYDPGRRTFMGPDVRCGSGADAQQKVSMLSFSERMRTTLLRHLYSRVVTTDAVTGHGINAVVASTLASTSGIRFDYRGRARSLIGVVEGPEVGS